MGKHVTVGHMNVTNIIDSGLPMDIDDILLVGSGGYIGIGISILCALFMSSGLCLQKLVHLRISKDSLQGPAVRHSMYIAGVGYVCIGLLLRGLMDVMLPQSAVAPLSAQTVIFTSILEHMFLDGTMTWQMICSLCVTVIGIVLAEFGANKTDGIYSIHDLWSLFSRKECIYFTAIMLGLVITLPELLKLTNSKWSWLVYFCVSSGIFAGWSGVLMKAVLEVLKYSFIHGSMSNVDLIGSWRAAGLLLMLVLAGLVGVIKMQVVHKALATFHHLQFLPLYQSMVILFTAVCGVLYYNDCGIGRLQYMSSSDLSGGVTVVVISHKNTQDSVISSSSSSSEAHVTGSSLVIPAGYTGLPEVSYVYLLGLLLVCLGVASLSLKYDEEMVYFKDETSKGHPSDESVSLLGSGDGDRYYKTLGRPAGQSQLSLSGRFVGRETGKDVESGGGREMVSGSRQAFSTSRQHKEKSSPLFDKNISNTATKNNFSNIKRDKGTTRSHGHGGDATNEEDLDSDQDDFSPPRTVGKDSNRLTFSGVARVGQGVEEQHLLPASYSSHTPHKRVVSFGDLATGGAGAGAGTTQNYREIMSPYDTDTNEAAEQRKDEAPTTSSASTSTSVSTTVRSLFSAAIRPPVLAATTADDDQGQAGVGRRAPAAALYVGSMSGLHVDDKLLDDMLLTDNVNK